MITLEEDKITVDLRNLSHSKNLNELWETDTDAFKYGLWYPRMAKYLVNANIKKKNPMLYAELSDVMSDTLEYSDKITELGKDYIGEDGDVSMVGIVNYILENLEFKHEDDRKKVAFILGVITISRISENQ